MHFLTENGFPRFCLLLRQATFSIALLRIRPPSSLRTAELACRLHITLSCQAAVSAAYFRMIRQKSCANALWIISRWKGRRSWPSRIIWRKSSRKKVSLPVRKRRKPEGEAKNLEKIIPVLRKRRERAEGNRNKCSRSIRPNPRCEAFRLNPRREIFNASKSRT